VTFADRIASKRKKLSLVIKIQGIETILQETDSFDYSDYVGSARDTYACIVAGSVEEGEQFIDLDKRAVLGGSLTFKLKEKHGQTVLADMLTPRKRRETYVSTTALAADSTITIANGTGLPSAGTVYIGAETVTYTSITGFSTILNGCTRGAFDTRAVDHLASADSIMSCEDVYTSPPFWRGRRVYLVGVFLNEDGTPSGASSFQDLGTYTIEESPRLSEGGTWEFNCAPLADEIAARQCYVGFKEAKCSRVSDNGDGTLLLEVDDATAFTSPGSIQQVMVRFENGSCSIASIIDADTTSGASTVTVVDTPGYFARGNALLFNAYTSLAETGKEGGTCSLIYAWSYSPSSDNLMYILQSDMGDTANGAYDLLQGHVQTDALDYRGRMGAAIHEDDINVASFAGVDEAYTWSYILDRAATAGEVLSDYCLAYNAFWLIRDGQLTVKKLGTVAGSSAFTFDESNYVAGSLSIEYDETGAKASATVKTNYDPVTQDLTLTMNVLDTKLLQKFPQQMDKVEFDVYGVSVSLNGTTAPNQVSRFVRPSEVQLTEFEDLVHRWQKTDARGRCVVSLVADTSAFTVGIGDLVDIDLPSLPDLEGSTLQASAYPFRVISRRPDYANGTVALSMMMLEKMYLVAPSATYVSISTNIVPNDTITIAETGLAAARFPAGTAVRLWDVDAGSSQTLTVAASVGSQIRFTTGVSGTPEANVDWLEWGNITTNTGITTPAGYVEGDYLYVSSLRRWQ
jgi:hypothetical protein